MDSTLSVSRMLDSGRWLTVDTETTGVDVCTARIVEVYTGTSDGAVTDCLVDPGIDIPAEATAIHGITTARAGDHGRPPVEALTDVRGDLRDAWDDGWLVIGFNLPYDLSLIEVELNRHGLPGLGPIGYCLDPLAIDRWLRPYRRGSRRLTTLCAAYGVPLSERAAHGARADAVAASRLARAMDVTGTPAEVQLVQETTHRRWADHYAEWLTGRGSDASGVDPAWPIRTNLTPRGPR